MSENPIAISNLNDFIFCPVSIYFHGLDMDTDNMLFQDTDQINGTDAHKTVDTGAYSTKRDMLQGISVYSEQYNLMGKIDVFDVDNGRLTERKKKIKTVYDGYIFQLYAQYFALMEMGYKVKEIRLYSMDDNKAYPIKLPSEDGAMFQKFQQLLRDMAFFQLETFKQDNLLKCQRCIYEPLCSYSALKEDAFG